jgi:SAM-dependent methyltransferase
MGCTARGRQTIWVRMVNRADHGSDHLPAAFYATAQGRLAARLIGARLARIWSPAPGMVVLGIGYPFPYLEALSAPATRCLAVVPRPARIARWPGEALGRVCQAEEDCLPFPDLSVDRVLLVHALEVAQSGSRLLREVWRVLKAEGRVLVVAPNRRGMWAHMETTPFGQGQPYSRGQIDRMLARQLFRLERRDDALYVPPLPARLLPPGARMLEAAGRFLLPEFGGVTITEAAKDVLGVTPLPVAEGKFARRPLRVFEPV